MRYSALKAITTFYLRDYMFDKNDTPINSANECDIEAMFDEAILEAEHGHEVFDQMLQSFAQKLKPQETTAQAMTEFLAFSRRVTEHLISIEFEIVYS